MSVKIQKVELEINGNIIRLSLKEAKELKDILNEVFPEEKITYIPSIPIFVERDPWMSSYPSWHQPPTYCNTETGNTLRLICSGN